MEKTIGQVAYETFRLGQCGQRPGGGVLRTWEQSSAEVHATWEEIADAAVRQHFVRQHAGAAA